MKSCRISRRRFLSQSGAASSLVSTIAPSPAAAESPAGAEVRDQKTALAVYNYNTAHAGIYKPYFNPLFGLNGKPITQDGTSGRAGKGRHRNCMEHIQQANAGLRRTL